MLKRTAHKSKGQVLVVQAFCLFLIVLLFMHSIKFAEGLKYKQESQLRADLVALSAARVQAEHLQLISVINQMMLYELQAIYLSLVASVIAAPISAKIIKHNLQSIKNLARLQKQFIKLNPILVYWQVQRIALANGFQGAFIHPIWPELPLSPVQTKYLRDSLTIATDNPVIKQLPIAQEIVTLLKEMEAEEYETLSKGNSNSQKNKKESKRKSTKEGKKENMKVEPLAHLVDGLSIGKLANKKTRRQQFQILINRMRDILPAPHYLNTDYINNQITVFCFDSEKNMAVASSRITHFTIPRSEELIHHMQNNYFNYFLEPTNVNGFQTELVPVPDYLEKIDKLSKSLDNVFEQLKKSPVEIPLSKEHLKWIQH